MPNIELYNQSATLQEVAEGSAQAFARLFNAYYGPLRAYLYKQTASWTDADEIIQETFIRVWLHRDQLPGFDNLQGWIFRVAAREYLTWVRKTLQVRKVTTAVSNNPFGEQQVDTTPLEETHIREMNRLVQQAVAQLPDQRRRIYRLSREEGLKIAEIAQRLQIAESTVKNALTVVLRDIRDYLARHGHPLLAMIWYCVTKN